MSHTDNDIREEIDTGRLVEKIRAWGKELGFADIGIADTDLAVYEQRLDEWIEKGRHGEMEWMHAHGRKRTRPALLHPNTRPGIVARMEHPEASARPVLGAIDQTDTSLVAA